MQASESEIHLLPCLDSEEMAQAMRQEMWMSHERAAELGRSALAAIRNGFYLTKAGIKVEWQAYVEAARSAKRSIPPHDSLPPIGDTPFPVMRVQVTNETTLGAARRLTGTGLRPLALNFANGIHPGGGFLAGSFAQEEYLCRSSALYATLEGDPMYAAHRQRPQPDSTDWAILSPDVPVFRTDGGNELYQPWLLSFVTCAAPFAPKIGQPESGDLLEQRIHRLLAIARAYDYSALVLGGWGCGAYKNDRRRTAEDFREALAGTFRGAFTDVVFAVRDWSPERESLGPFRDVFSELSG